MGQIIGKNTLTGAPTSASATSEKLLYGTLQQVTLAANQKLISVNVGWGGKSANPTGSPVFQVGLYDVSGGDFTTAPLLFVQTFSFNNADHELPAHLITIALDVDISAHAGKELAIGFAAPNVNHAFDVLIETVTGAFRKNDTGAASTLPATLALGSVVSNQAWCVFFETADIAGPRTIDSLGTSGTVRVGATENITTTGLGTLTTANVGSKAAATIAAPSGDGTITLASFVDGETYPAMGTASAVVGDGTGTATKSDAVLETMAGWQWVNVTSLSTTEFSLGRAFSGGDVPTQLHVIDDGTGVLNADGTLTDWPVGTYTCWARMAAGTWPVGTMKSFTFTVHEPIDTAGSDLIVSTNFTSPVLSLDITITPNDWTVEPVLSSPALSQSSIVEPTDLVITTDLSQPEINTSGALIVDDLVLATLMPDPALTQAYLITPNNLTITTLFSSPTFGEDQPEPEFFYGNRIVLIRKP